MCSKISSIFNLDFLDLARRVAEALIAKYHPVLYLNLFQYHRWEFGRKTQIQIEGRYTLY